MNDNNFRISGAEIFIDGQFVKKDISVKGNRIASVDAPGQGTPTLGFDGKGMKVIPGFFDVHSHGGGGEDFNLCSEEGLHKILGFYASHGVSSVLATVLTDTDDVITKQLRMIARAKEAGAVQIAGIHLEGPFLCKDYKGAMPEYLLQKPDFKSFMGWQEAAGGLIRLITIAPELEGAAEFTKQAVDSGCVVSMGHSGADYRQTMACIDNGAMGITHTMNGMKLIHQHDPGILTAAFLSNIYCEIICDGRHLYPEIVELLLKIQGRDRLLGVTDSIMAAGLPDGEYRLGVNDVVVLDGDAKLKDGGSRAGSTLTMEQGLRNYIGYTRQSLEEALPVYTKNPVEYLNLAGERGTIEAGKYADFVLCRIDNGNNIEIVETFSSGKPLLGRVTHQ